MKRGYKETEIGEIPEEWDFDLLENLADIRLSNVDKITNSDERAVSLCNYLHVYRNRYINSSVVFDSGSATNIEIEKFALKRGDVVITKDSEDPKDIAVPTFVEENIPNLVCGYHLAILRSKGKVSGNYLAKLFEHKAFNRYFQNRANGATRFGLGTDVIQKAPIPLPPLSEQKKIAEILSSVDETIRATQAVIDQAKVVKQGMLNQLLTRGIGHKKFKQTEIGEIPEEWEVKTLGEIADISGGTTPPTGNALYWDNGNILWATPTDITKLSESEKYISDTETKITKKALEECYLTHFPIGSVLMTSRASVGFTAIAKNPIATNQGFCVFYNFKDVENTFLQYLLASLRSVILRHSSGSTFKEISRSSIKKISTILPPIAEQRKIVKILSSIDSIICENQSQINILKLMKSGLMQDLLTGKKQVKVG